MRKLMSTFKTDSMGFTSKPFWKYHIYDVEVEVRMVEHSLLVGKNAKERTTKRHFNAYAELKGSETLSGSFLSHPTFRREDWVGVDTAHSFNEKHTDAEKLSSALSQIQYIIEEWMSATKDGFYIERG
jgi:hypothetical protein